MKILWICNVVIPRIFKIRGEENSNFSGGWLDGMAESLLKKKYIELVYCYPNYVNNNLIDAHEDNFYSYGIPMKYDEAIKKLNQNSLSIACFKEIVAKEKPDIIHIWGTEFIYSLEFYKAAVAVNQQYKSNTAVSIQGLIGICAKHYDAGIPSCVMNFATLSEIKGMCTLKMLKRSFEYRGKKEEELLKLIERVIGRTSWDRACSNLINSNLKYYVCNESLRDSFYDGAWKVENCRLHQIFVSQASYPLKGFHKLLEAVNYIKADYPDLLIKVAGQNIFEGNYIKGNSYGNYIKRLIRNYNLDKNIIFMGMINAEEMKKIMLESNVFVCPSAIENSSNSLGEAMLLGVPCIASNVGGTQDMLEHGREGFLYPYNETYRLADYIRRIFDDKQLACDIGKSAKKKAEITHDRTKNNEVLCSIYNDIMKNS